MESLACGVKASPFTLTCRDHYYHIDSMLCVIRNCATHGSSPINVSLHTRHPIPHSLARCNAKTRHPVRSRCFVYSYVSKVVRLEPCERSKLERAALREATSSLPTDMRVFLTYANQTRAA